MKDCKKLLMEDIEQIYLGNLSTVEADIALPSKGKNGTVFSWSSSDERRLSVDGKVYRPPFTGGNREVVLTLTATLGDVTQTRQYTANILEMEYPFELIKAYDIEIFAEKGTQPDLPLNIIAVNNLGEDVMMPVKWDSADSTACGADRYVVKGYLQNNVTVNATITVTDDKNLLNPCIDREKVIEKYEIKDVRLLQSSGFYAQQQRVLEHFLNADCDSYLYNFRTAAGLDTKGAKQMTGWDAPECNLKGHTTGHFLSGMALCFAATGNKQIKEKLDYMVQELGECQDKMASQPDKFGEGFLSAYDESQFDLLEVYTVYPKIWAPYYTLHKIMAGLRDCYLYAENTQALDILKKIGMWVYNRLSRLPKAQRDKMWAMYIAGEFGGINEVLADLYLITKDERYLSASRYFDNDKLYLQMKMGIDALGNIHANQHIPQIIGVLKQFEATKEKHRWDIADNFWNFVTSDHIYSIGGVGETEMFRPKKQIAKYISEKTAESCASYNMLKLTGMLYQYYGSAEYMHYYENTVTNHILASGDISSASGLSTYFMPASPGGCKHFDKEENSCCHGTGYESHFKYGEYIYAKDKDSVIVNLFIPSRLDNGKDVIELDAKAEENSFDVVIKADKLSAKELKVRKPLWAEKALITVDNMPYTPVEENGYYVFDITKGNIILSFECRPYIKSCIDDADTASVCWGPYVLAAISESKEFISISQKDIAELQHKGNLLFALGDMIFKPLNAISSEHYHLYIKVQ
ncbi:MAG: glycoside hydrolase family 127 protein [Oscillospiraceae bacterium]|nr:glycoside hydrolase family 127 protein [Oscillospiraceae bacterium]